MRTAIVGLLGIGMLSVGNQCRAALVLSSIASSYSQDFDSLPATGVDVAWPLASPLEGWSLYRIPNNANTSPAVSIDTIHTGDGSSDSAGFYSFGSTGQADRALGAIGNGNLGSFGGSGILGIDAVIGWITVAFTNDTANTVTQFSVEYAGEKWRDGGGDLTQTQTMVFEYGFGSSFDSATWTAPGGNFDWTSPVTTTEGDKVDGNTDGSFPGRGGAISGLNWAPGETLYLRWVERNDSGLDNGLAIDDFVFSVGPSAVPEPGAILFGTAVCVTVGIGACVRRARGGRMPR